MKILYYDCFCGISGDMNLGALIDLGVDKDYVRQELSKLHLDAEYELQVTKEMKKGISGTKVNVMLKNEEHCHHHHGHQHEQEGHHHHHHHEEQEHHHIPITHAEHSHHEHRNLKDIEHIIQASSLSDKVKQISLDIFMRVAQAEAKVHGKPLYEVHFHEVGATDSIIDIVGAAIALDYLEVDKIMASTVQLGGGFVKCAHGIIPIPAPATIEILKNIPVKSGIVSFETTTPTGAAILAANVEEFTDTAEFSIEKIGYGIGHRDLDIPNVLRVYLGTKKQGVVKNDTKDQAAEVDRCAREKSCDQEETSRNSEKYEKLINYLQKLESVVLAFSGGVDSTFLLKATQEALGDQVKAVTIRSPYIPKWEIEEAKELVKELGILHEIIEAPIIDEIRNNPENRCYLCKKAVFSMIEAVAQKEGYHYVIDGTNFDDLGDYRPGLKALQELKVKSPLLECQLTKKEVRSLSKELGLPTWDKPPYACLLTRIPYGNELKVEDFEKIEKAEKYMMDRGFRAIRVRCHGNLARIEVDRVDRKRLFDEKILEEISSNFKEFGFKYITLDVEGYRVGSFNETMASQ